jgi:membrane-bound serine protease (ClpP class)
MSMDHAVGGHGLLMTGGAVAFGAGSFLLYDRADPSLRISLSLIVGCLAAAVGFSLIVLKSAWGTRRIKPAVGREALVGKTAETREGGQVFVEGQLWTAEGYGPFRPGEKVSIVGVEGNKLIIEKL